MEDPEQQDSDEDEVRDDDRAAPTSSVRPIVHSLLRNYDPLGPLRAQIASISRVWQQPMLDAVARKNAVIGAAMAASAKPQPSTFNPGWFAGVTGQSVLSKGALNAMAVNTAWQRSMGDSMLAASVSVKPQLAFLTSDSARFAAITGPPLWSKGVLDTAAAATAWQNSILDGVRAATVKPQLGILSSVRLFESSWASSYTSPLSAIALQTASFPSSLHQIAGQIGRVFTQDLLSKFDALRGLFRDWLPDNLRDVDADWLWLLRICAKDGTCLAWAPRAGIVAGLLALRHSADRRRYLMEHRLEVVEDVEASLKEVDHPDLLAHRGFTLQAADCLRDGHDAAAQALLANVLDTVMRDHGHAWLRSYFPQATFTGAGSHKMIAGAHGTHTGGAELRMLAPYLLVNALKNVFLNGVDRQHTFNRHLGAHHASTDTYRSEFAFAALLNTQALLRLMDRYLYA